VLSVAMHPPSEPWLTRMCVCVCVCLFVPTCVRVGPQVGVMLKIAPDPGVVLVAPRDAFLAAGDVPCVEACMGPRLDPEARAMSITALQLRTLRASEGAAPPEVGAISPDGSRLDGSGAGSGAPPGTRCAPVSMRPHE
jgi:hypothetical protein